MATSSELVLDADALQAIGLYLGEAIRVARPMAWGWATPTTFLELASGRRVVVQRRNRRAADRIGTATRVFEDAGIPVPQIHGAVSERAGALLIFEFVPGEIAAAHLEGPGGLTVARLMGAALVGLRSIDPDRLPLDGAWESPGALLDTAGSWESAVPPGALRVDAATCLRRVARSDWTATISHGDYVPVNAVIENGQLAALLDLDDVAARHPLLDLAWWSLVVRHHHPSSSGLIDPLIATVSGGDPRPSERRVADVAVARALQLVATGASDQRDHLLALLATAVAWAEAQPIPPVRPGA